MGNTGHRLRDMSKLWRKDGKLIRLSGSLKRCAECPCEGGAPSTCPCGNWPLTTDPDPASFFPCGGLFYTFALNSYEFESVIDGRLYRLKTGITLTAVPGVPDPFIDPTTCFWKGSGTLQENSGAGWVDIGVRDWRLNLFTGLTNRWVITIPNVFAGVGSPACSRSNSTLVGAYVNDAATSNPAWTNCTALVA